MFIYVLIITVDFAQVKKGDFMIYRFFRRIVFFGRKKRLFVLGQIVKSAEKEELMIFFVWGVVVKLSLNRVRERGGSIRL